MTIIVDAYNFIKQALGKTLISDAEIRGWINSFREYARLKNNQIILVFDAGPYAQRSFESHGHVSIIYSGHKQSADEVIKEWLSQNRERDILVVTSDREIRDFASGVDIVSVGSLDFYKIFNRVSQQEISYEQKIIHTLHKTTEDESSELDELMEKSSRYLTHDSMPREDAGIIRIRNGKKVSKQDKRILKKLEKI